MYKQAMALAFVLSAGILSCKHQQPSPSSSTTVNTLTPPIDIPADSSFIEDNLRLSFTEMKPDQFNISADTISVLTGTKGLRITVDPAALETESGNRIKGNISINMIELADTKDFLKANTATVSNGKLLASGGSYFISMYAGSEKLHIKKGASITAEFPVLRQKEMELFYGNRNDDGDMNWTTAGIPLVPGKPAEAGETIEFSDNALGSSTAYLPSLFIDTAGKAKVFKSLNEKIYYYNHFISITDLLDSVNKHELRAIIDTVNMWPKLEKPLKPGEQRDIGWLLSNFGPEKQFIVRSLVEEARRKAKKNETEATNAVVLNHWQPETLTGQILKYYSPVKLPYLGWINCDRFYKNDQPCNTEIEMPIALQKTGVKYFLLFPSINSLMSGAETTDKNGKLVLSGLPKGETFCFIGFVKSGGKIFQCKQNVVAGDDEHLKANFAEISAAELKHIFGMNIKT